MKHQILIVCLPKQNKKCTASIDIHTGLCVDAFFASSQICRILLRLLS